MSKALARAAILLALGLPALHTVADEPRDGAGRAGDEVREILEREEIETEISPSFGAYLRDARARLFGAALDRISEAGWIGTAAKWILWALVVVVPLAVGWMLFRSWSTPRRRPAARGAREQSEELVPVEPESPSDLRAEIEASLARGARAETLSLLWRWVAGRLRAEGVADFSPELTNRECARVVRRVRPGWYRQERLERFVRALDRLLYAEVRLGGAELRALVADADELVS